MPGDPSGRLRRGDRQPRRLDLQPQGLPGRGRRLGAPGVVHGDNTMPVMTTAPDRRARRREETRARLVEAAKALFARQGVDNTRIQEITDEADVGFGSFYNHFQSKEALIEAGLAASACRTKASRCTPPAAHCLP